MLTQHGFVRQSFFSWRSVRNERGFKMLAGFGLGGRPTFLLCLTGVFGTPLSRGGILLDRCPWPRWLPELRILLPELGIGLLLEEGSCLLGFAVWWLFSTLNIPVIPSLSNLLFVHCNMDWSSIFPRSDNGDWFKYFPTIAATSRFSRTDAVLEIVCCQRLKISRSFNMAITIKWWSVAESRLFTRFSHWRRNWSLNSELCLWVLSYIHFRFKLDAIVSTFVSYLPGNSMPSAIIVWIFSRANFLKSSFFQRVNPPIPLSVPLPACWLIRGKPRRRFCGSANKIACLEFGTFVSSSLSSLLPSSITKDEIPSWPSACAPFLIVTTWFILRWLLSLFLQFNILFRLRFTGWLRHNVNCSSSKFAAVNRQCLFNGSQTGT